MFKMKSNERGCITGDFEDLYGKRCSIQESSLADKNAIWLGIDDAEPMVLATDAERLGVPTEAVNGWVPYSIPKEVLLHTRMHLTQEMVSALLPMLLFFVENGQLPPMDQDAQKSN